MNSGILDDKNELISQMFSPAPGSSPLDLPASFHPHLEETGQQISEITEVDSSHEQLIPIQVEPIESIQFP